jgi:hypothetical protein
MTKIRRRRRLGAHRGGSDRLLSISTTAVAAHRALFISYESSDNGAKNGEKALPFPVAVHWLNPICTLYLRIHSTTPSRLSVREGQSLTRTQRQQLQWNTMRPATEMAHCLLRKRMINWKGPSNLLDLGRTYSPRPYFCWPQVRRPPPDRAQPFWQLISAAKQFAQVSADQRGPF